MFAQAPRLRGTGGNENDLVPFAVGASRSQAAVSPRGKVLGNGMWRFFKRHANSIFDESGAVKRVCRVQTQKEEPFRHGIWHTHTVGLRTGCQIN